MWLDRAESCDAVCRFCSECKLKVSEALELLISNCEHTHRDRPGFCPNLYAGE